MTTRGRPAESTRGLPWKPSPGARRSRSPTRCADPGTPAAPRAGHRQGPGRNEARGPHGLHAVLPLGRSAADLRRWPTSVLDRATAAIVTIRLQQPLLGSASRSPCSPSASARSTGPRRSCRPRVVEPRHATRGRGRPRRPPSRSSTTRTRSPASGAAPLIRNTLIGAVVASPRSPASCCPSSATSAPRPADPLATRVLSHTMWKEGTRLARDPDGTPIRAADVTLGSAFHVIPEGLATRLHRGQARGEGQGDRAAHAPATRATSTRRPSAQDWSYDGIVAYSKVCTHVGCPVALYEQQTHHLLCPCHQSQFDVTNGAARSSSARPTVRCRSCRSPSTPRATSSRTSDFPNPSARASGSVIEYRNSPHRRTPERPRRPVDPPKNGKPLGGRFTGAARTTSTSARASRASSRSSAARSSPTTGRSCSARSRCTASSSSCSRARS